MAIPTRRRLRPYEILSAVGAGDIGEACPGGWTRLDHIVASNVLPARLAIARTALIIRIGGVAMHLGKLALCGLLVCGSVFAVPGPMRAQINTVNLSGTVLDPQNLAVKGATVTLKNLATGAERTSTSDANGRYEVVGLPPGNYSLSVEAQGFATQTNPSLTLTLGVAAEYNPQLQLKSGSESVTVEALPELVETTKTDVSNTITSRQ